MEQILLKNVSFLYKVLAFVLGYIVAGLTFSFFSNVKLGTIIVVIFSFFGLDISSFLDYFEIIQTLFQITLTIYVWMWVYNYCIRQIDRWITNQTNIVNPLEQKAWFRLAKVIYIGTCILATLVALLILQFGELSDGFWIIIVMAATLFFIQKGFYYVVLGKTDWK